MEEKKIKIVMGRVFIRSVVSVMLAVSTYGQNSNIYGYTFGGGDRVAEADIYGDNLAIDLLENELGTLVDRNGSDNNGTLDAEDVNDGNNGNEQDRFNGVAPLTYTLLSSTALISNNGFLLSHYTESFRAQRANKHRFSLLGINGATIGSTSSAFAGAVDGDGGGYHYISYSNNGQIISDVSYRPDIIIQAPVKNIAAATPTVRVGRIVDLRNRGTTDYTFVGGTKILEVPNAAGEIIGQLMISGERIRYVSIVPGFVQNFSFEVTAMSSGNTYTSPIAEFSFSSIFFQHEVLIDDVRTYFPFPAVATGGQTKFETIAGFSLTTNTRDVLISGFSDVIISDATTITNNMNVVAFIQTTSGDDTITIADSAIFTGAINALGGTDTLIYMSTVSSPVVAKNYQILNIENIRFDDKYILGSNFSVPQSVNNISFMDDTVINVNSTTFTSVEDFSINGSLTINSGGLSGDVVFVGTNDFQNTAVFSVDSLTFANTTYKVSSSTGLITAPIIDIGNLLFEVDDALLSNESFSREIFDTTTSLTLTTLTNIRITNSRGNNLPPQNYFLFQDGDIISIVKNDPPVKINLSDPGSRLTVSTKQRLVTIDVLDGITDSASDKSAATVIISDIIVNPNTFLTLPGNNSSNAQIDTTTLSEGDRITIIYSYTDRYNRMVDNTIEVNIIANVPAVISPFETGSNLGTVFEDGNLTTRGRLISNDADDLNNMFIAASSNARYGTYSIDSQGNWIYNLNNENSAVQFLSVGESLTDSSFNIQSIDGTIYSGIKIMILGAYDMTDYVIDDSGIVVNVLKNITGDFEPNGPQVGANLINRIIPSTATDIIVNSEVAITGNIIGFDTVILNKNSSVNSITSTSQDDNITIMGASVMTVNAGGGADNITIMGDASVMTVDAGGGADNITIMGDASVMTVDAGGGDDNITIMGDASVTAVDAGAGADTVTVISENSFNTSIFLNVEELVKRGVGNITVDSLGITDFYIEEGTLDISKSSSPVTANITLKTGTRLVVNIGTIGRLNSDRNPVSILTGESLNNTSRTLTLEGDVSIEIANSMKFNSSNYKSGVTYFIIANGGLYNLDDLTSLRIIDDLEGGLFEYDIIGDDLVAIWNDNSLLSVVQDRSVSKSRSASDALGAILELSSNDQLTQLNQDFVEIFVELFEQADVQDRKELIESLPPTIQTTFAPAVGTVVSDISTNLNSRNLGNLDTGILTVNGPNNFEIDLVANGHFWYDFSYGTGDRDGNDVVPGFGYDGYTARVGYDRAFNEFFLGTSVAFGKTTIDNSNESGNADINTFSLAFYGNTQKEDSAVSAVLVLAFSDIDATRNRGVLADSLQGSSQAFSFDLDLSYAKITDDKTNLKFTYLYGLRYNYSQISGINESGAELATKTEDQNYPSLFLKLGSIITWNLNQHSNNKHSFSLLADVQYNLLNVERNVPTQFTNGGGQFETDGVDEDKLSVAIGTGWLITNEGVSLELGYNYRFSEIISSNTLSVKIKYNY